LFCCKSLTKIKFPDKSLKEKDNKMGKNIAVRALKEAGAKVEIPIGDILRIHHLNDRPKVSSVSAMLKETLRELKKTGCLDFAYAVMGTPRGTERVLIPVSDVRILTSNLR
jgi:hypothetical protein